MPRWRRDALTCRRAVDLVTAYLEGTLSVRERERYEAHLEACAHCRAYLDQMRKTVQLSGRLKEQDIEPAARERLAPRARRARAARAPPRWRSSASS